MVKLKSERGESRCAFETRITPDVSEGEVFRAGLVVRSSLHDGTLYCLLPGANRLDV